MNETILLTEESVNDVENSKNKEQYEDKTELLAQYISIIPQITLELTGISRHYFDENELEHSFKVLADFNFPIEVFQKFHVSSKFNLIIFSSNKYSKDFLSSYIHTAKIVFGQGFNNYPEFKYLAFSPFESDREYIPLPLWRLQKIEELYSLKRSSRNFCDLLNDVFASQTYRSATSERNERIGIYLTSLLFLAQHYGENAVSEVITKSLEEETFCSAIDVETLIKNYDHFKEYPLQWALEITREGTPNNEKRI